MLCGDLTGKGSLDLIVVTMGGDVISLAIDGPADESNSWRGVPRGVGGRSGFAHGGLEAIVVNVLPSEIHATLHDGGCANELFGKTVTICLSHLTRYPRTCYIAILNFRWKKAIINTPLPFL